MTVHFRASREMTWLEKISLGWMRHAFSVSQKGSDHIVSSGKIRKEDATMLGDGVIPEDYCGKDKEGISVRGQLSIGVDEFVVMLPATLQPGKGQNLTVQAARLLANKGLKIKWLLAGSEHYQFPGFKGKLRQAVAESGCETSVLLLGHRDDIPELLAASDIMLLPSVLTEGKPCTIMEAMAAGKPVVASRVGGIPEMVDDEVGMLIDPGDPSAIAGAVEKFFGDRELLKRCGDAARTRAGQRYNAGAITQKMVEVFSSIIKDGIA
jgi:glycosyltransferase involved in cell wall biosynthesis